MSSQDPLAYDRLVRRFQSPMERETEGKKKGYSGILEADLWRSEAKVEALANPDKAASMRYIRSQNGEILAEEKEEVPSSKEEGLSRWRVEMELRFVSGEDVEFDYNIVDQNEEFDDWHVQERERQETWFEAEEPKWVSSGNAHNKEEGPAVDLKGETGIQDF